MMMVTDVMTETYNGVERCDIFLYVTRETLNVRDHDVSHHHWDFLLIFSACFGTKINLTPQLLSVIYISRMGLLLMYFMSRNLNFINLSKNNFYFTQLRKKILLLNYNFLY